MVLQNESCRESGVLLHFDESPLEIPLDLSVSSRSLQSSSPSSYEHHGRNKLIKDFDEDGISYSSNTAFDGICEKESKLPPRNYYDSLENVSEMYAPIPKSGLRIRPAEDILKKECLPNECSQTRNSFSNHSSREHSREHFYEHQRDHSREPLREGHREILGETFNDVVNDVCDKYRRGRSPVPSKRGFSNRSSVSPHASLFTPPQFENLSLKGESSNGRPQYKGIQRDLHNGTDPSKLYLAVTGVDPNYINRTNNPSDYYSRSRSPSLPNERTINSRSQSPSNFAVDQSYRCDRSPFHSSGNNEFYRRCPTPPRYHSEHVRPPTPVSPPTMDTSESAHSYQEEVPTTQLKTNYAIVRTSISPKANSMNSILRIHSTKTNDNNSANHSMDDEDEDSYNKSSSSPDDFRETTSSPESEEKSTLRRDYKKDMLKRFCKYCFLCVGRYLSFSYI